MAFENSSQGDCDDEKGWGDEGVVVVLMMMMMVVMVMVAAQTGSR